MIIIIVKYILEHLSNVDEILGEMFLEEKTPTTEEIKVIQLGYPDNDAVIYECNYLNLFILYSAHT